MDSNPLLGHPANRVLNLQSCGKRGDFKIVNQCIVVTDKTIEEKFKFSHSPFPTFQLTNSLLPPVKLAYLILR